MKLRSNKRSKGTVLSRESIQTFESGWQRREESR